MFEKGLLLHMYTSVLQLQITSDCSVDLQLFVQRGEMKMFIYIFVYVMVWMRPARDVSKIARAFNWMQRNSQISWVAMSSVQPWSFELSYDCVYEREHSRAHPPPEGWVRLHVGYN